MSMKFVDQIEEVLFYDELHEEFNNHVGDVSELLRLEREQELDEMLENTK
jgi:hypothetical protein